MVKWIAESNRPANILTDHEFISMLTAGRPHITIPSPSTITRDVKSSFEACHSRISQLLRDHTGRLHFGTDAWTSPNQRAFVVWMVHLEHDGQMLSFLLDIVGVPESHTGQTLAKAFHKMLVDFGIQNKILSVVADNVSANNTQTAALAALDNSFEEEARIRCFNHTVSLSAKAFLVPFNTAIGGADPDDLIADVEALNIEEEDDNDNDIKGGNDEEPDVDDGIDELEALEELARDNLIIDTTSVRSMISKVRQLSFSIINSSTIALPAWSKFCATLDLKIRHLPRDVTTRWNSTYDMLIFALKYRQAIDGITADKEFKLHRYELDEEEWTIVNDLSAVLKQFKQATLYFSQDNASVAAVIPAMDHITKGLDPRTKKPYHPAIVAALKLARNKMNRYYSLTDTSIMYCIVMVLHPGMKLDYFQQAAWEADWIEEAEGLVRAEYVSHYENNDFVYPTLHLMALDFLSIPATSTAVERVFSQGRCCEVSCFSLLSGTETVPSGRVVHLRSWVRLDSLSLRTLSL